MVLVLIVGGIMNWIIRALKSRNAVSAIRKAASGVASYDWELEGDEIIPNRRLWWPKSLVDRVGPDYFGSVAYIYFTDPGSDADLAYVGQLGRLKSLQLESSRVTDAGLAHLEGLTGLYVLMLDGTQITDAGLIHLKGMTALRALSLRGTQVTDAGLVHLEGFDRVQILHLEDTKVTDAGLCT